MARRANKNNRNEAVKISRILLVDDHPMVRERLTDVINRHRDLRTCGEAEDHHEALDAIPGSKPDLVIVDLHLKRSDGLDLIKDIVVRHPGLYMLVLSMHDESSYAERALRAGAHGYITKQHASTDIVAAIRTVLAGEVYMSPGLAVSLACKATGHRPQPTATPDTLSDREIRVFEYIGQGFRMSEIAEMLHLDQKTIETYRMRIKEKLKLKDANEVLKHAIQWSRKMAGG